MSRIILHNYQISLHNRNIDYVKPTAVDTKRETFGGYIRRVRTEKKLSLADVSRRSGGLIDGSYVNRIENGYVTNPTPAKLKAIAHGLGVDPQELFDLAQGKKAKDSEDYRDSKFAVMAFKYDGMKASPKQKLRIEALIELLDRELDEAQGE